MPIKKKKKYQRSQKTLAAPRKSGRSEKPRPEVIRHRQEFGHFIETFSVQKNREDKELHSSISIRFTLPSQYASLFHLNMLQCFS